MASSSIFDIIGPIMIGPSSSHTAGAARLGKIASIIAGENIKKVKFLLHGSFAKTYKGHGTDRALIAGILRMEPWDEKLKNSYEIAKKKNIEIEFEEVDLGDVHPNTVKFVITKQNGDIVDITGASIGGGSIRIFNILGQEVDITGEYPTIIIEHNDVPGMISKTATLLKNINVAYMKVYRSSRGKNASMTFETDSIVSNSIINKIKKIDGIRSVKVINPVMEGEE